MTEPREWLVIEDSRKHAVFVGSGGLRSPGYIPRDVAEALLGRDLGGVTWFTKEESASMRAHPEWKSDLP